MPTFLFSIISCLVSLTICIGCQWIPPVNVEANTFADRVIVDILDGAVFYSEKGIDDGLWLEIERINEPGIVGGYISQNNNHRGALIILLNGASTYEPGGAEGRARVFHQYFGPFFRNAGYLTWFPVVRECGTAYGQGDLADLIEAIDWMERSGKVLLEVNHIYIFGYSTGWTLATLANRRRRVDAVVSISGITQPDQFKTMWSLYSFISQLFPHNTGVCQLRSTLEYYGPPESPTWEYLDSVNHLDEFLAPMLFIHGTDDYIFGIDNTLALEHRYREQIAQGEALPQMEFMYFPFGHSIPVSNPEVIELIIEFFDRFNPMADK
ncbi:MAG: prolyl oligopeptidase family serine peptidase [Planctomycetota bacterium]|nr:MAG: prolyl oligopeptidase family serine peptidase [Planctomycetota bacterium]